LLGNLGGNGGNEADALDIDIAEFLEGVRQALKWVRNTHLGNTNPSRVRLRILETRGRIPELDNILPVFEDPIFRIVIIEMVPIRMSFKISLEGHNGVFPGPASLRKAARNLESRQFWLTLELEISPKHRTRNPCCNGRNSSCQEQSRTR